MPICKQLRDNWESKPKKDLTGTKHGRWTILKFIPKKDRVQGYSTWFCKCECGKEGYVRNFPKGKNLSCGCLQKDVTRKLGYERHGVDAEEASVRKLMRGYKVNAINRNLEWNLNSAQVKALFLSNCEYCGCEPRNFTRKWDKTVELKYNGIDRIDSSKGYNIDNVVPCCKNCNIGKRSFSKEEFLGWVERVYSHSIVNVNELINKHIGANHFNLN